MLALHSAEAFDRVSRSLFRIEWNSATGSDWGTGFAIARLQTSKQLILATAKHVVEVALNEPAEWLVQQYDAQSNVARQIRFDTTPADTPSLVRVHIKMDLGSLVVPKAGKNGVQFSPNDEEPLCTMPEKFHLTPGTRVGWAGFPSIVHDLLSHHQPCYCEGVVAAAVYEPSRRLYVVDGHNTWGISGGPVWHWSDERDRLEIVAVVSSYKPGGELPGFCVFAPLESFEALFASWQKHWDAQAGRTPAC